MKRCDDERLREMMESFEAPTYPMRNEPADTSWIGYQYTSDMPDEHVHDHWISMQCDWPK